MTGFIWKIVGRYVRSRRGFTRVVTAFSVLGIAIGVAALIAVLAVMSGFRDELMGRILGVTGHATLTVQEMTRDDAVGAVERLRSLEGVAHAEALVQGQGMASSGGRSVGVMVRGVTGALPTFIADKVLGEPMGEDGLARGEVLVGQGIVRQLGVLPGGGINILSASGQRTIAGFIPSSLPAEVVGMFKFGMVQFDNGLILTSLEDAQRLFRTGDFVQGIEVRVTHPETIETLVPAFKNAIVDAMALQGHVLAPFDVRVETWKETNADFFQALQVERVTMFIILSLIVLVAAFNIITGQMMLVNDKLHDIAILRTMGATRGQILRIFFFNGILLGLLGVMGGVGLGMLIVFNMTGIVGAVQRLFGVNLFPGDVYFLTDLPARVNWSDMSFIVGMAMLLTILASFYPAWRAGRMTPVQLLRGE